MVVGRKVATNDIDFGQNCRVFPRWFKLELGSTKCQSQSCKVLLNMMVDSSLVALKVRTHRAFRQRRRAKLRGINLRLLSLLNTQAADPIRQCTICSARRPL